MNITVIGEALIERRPERGTLHLHLGLESADKQRVVRETTDLVNRVSAHVAQLRAANPAPVTWSAVSSLSNRSWNPHDDKGKPLQQRHAVAASMKVKFADFSSLSTFVDTWSQVPGVTVQYVTWTVTEQTRRDLERQVLAMAVSQARERATVIANACGFQTVMCTEAADPGLLNDTGSGASPTAFAGVRSARMMSEAGNQSGGIEIAPEDVRIAATLNLRFQAD